MKIEHIAIWAEDMDALCGFYVKYFGASRSTGYLNPKRNFTSCFLSFGDGGKEAVNALTERLRRDGHTIASEPRTTGDGYYESVALDPEGNPVETAA